MTRSCLLLLFSSLILTAFTPASFAVSQGHALVGATLDQGLQQKARELADLVVRIQQTGEGYREVPVSVLQDQAAQLQADVDAMIERSKGRGDLPAAANWERVPAIKFADYFIGISLLGLSVLSMTPGVLSMDPGFLVNQPGLFAAAFVGAGATMVFPFVSLKTYPNHPRYERFLGSLFALPRNIRIGIRFAVAGVSKRQAARRLDGLKLAFKKHLAHELNERKVALVRSDAEACQGILLNEQQMRIVDDEALSEPAESGAGAQLFQ